MVNLKKLMIGALATAGLVFGQAATAGLLTLTIDGIVCADGAACDSNPLPNFVQVIVGAGVNPAIPGLLSGSFEASFSNNPGTANFNIMDVTWALVASTGVGPNFNLMASQTDFNVGPVGPGAILQSVCSGDVSGGSSVVCQEWVNLGNTLNGLGPITPGAQGPFTAPFSNTAFSAPYTGTVPYSITDRLLFTLAAGTTSTGDLRSITPVKIPEPATLLLIGAALAGAGFARRRKQA